MTESIQPKEDVTRSCVCEMGESYICEEFADRDDGLCLHCTHEADCHEDDK